MTEWFEQWFGEAYLHLYGHRDDEDAAHAVELIARHIPLPDHTILDLACGPGRRAIHLRTAGASVVGFDLSMPLLSRARHRAQPNLPVVRGDMRYLPFAPDVFDVVVNLFTSFGYFSDDSQHSVVVCEVAGALRRQGWFVLDYLNASALLRGQFRAREEVRVGRQCAIIQRRITDDGRFCGEGDPPRG